MSNSNQSQNKRLLEHLRVHKSITQQEAYEKFGITRLASRIYDLRCRGFKLDGEMVPVPNRYGEKCRVKRYFLIGDSDG